MSGVALVCWLFFIGSAGEPRALMDAPDSAARRLGRSRAAEVAAMRVMNRASRWCASTSPDVGRSRVEGATACAG